MQVRPRLIAAVSVPLLVAGAIGATFGRTLLDGDSSGPRAATVTPVGDTPSVPADPSAPDGKGTDGKAPGGDDAETSGPSDEREGAKSRSERDRSIRDSESSASRSKKPKKSDKASEKSSDTGEKKKKKKKDAAKAPKDNGSFVAQVIRLTNAERKKHGCKALSSDPSLRKAAQEHSRDMAKNNYFAHDSQDGRSPFDRMREAGYEFSAAAENIAAGQRTPADVVDGWMNSSGHRDNIINCTYTEIGVGYAKGGSYGTYWTQNFAKPA